MAIVVCCGAECGIVTVGLAAQATRHWYAAVGTTLPTADATVYRSGAKSFKFVAGATRPELQWGHAASKTVGYFRTYFRLSTVPASDQGIYLANHAAGTDLRVRVLTTGAIKAGYDIASGVTASGITVAADQWYGLEIEDDVRANPNVARWRVWSAATGWIDQTNVSYAQAATTMGYSRFGLPDTGASSGITAYHDDVLIGNGTSQGEHYSATVPAHSAGILRQVPVSDNSPHPFTSNDFKYNNSTNIANTATDIYTYLDDADQTSIADFISQNVAWSTGTKACSINFATPAYPNGVPRYVAVTSTHHAASTLANEANVRISDDGTNWSNIWGNWAGTGIDVSDTSAHFKHYNTTAKPSGGAWTAASLAQVRCQFGQSNDISPVPYYDSISLEVDWASVSQPVPPHPARHFIRR